MNELHTIFALVAQLLLESKFLNGRYPTIQIDNQEKSHLYNYTAYKCPDLQLYFPIVSFNPKSHETVV